jgi:hypothetical protein
MRVVVVTIGSTTFEIRIGSESDDLRDHGRTAGVPSPCGQPAKDPLLIDAHRLPDLAAARRAIRIGS